MSYFSTWKPLYRALAKFLLLRSFVQNAVVDLCLNCLCLSPDIISSVKAWLLLRYRAFWGTLINVKKNKPLRNNKLCLIYRYKCNFGSASYGRSVGKTFSICYNTFKIDLHFTDENLRIALMEAQTILNFRPFTFNSLDSDE